nr:MAG TPA: hypothetical protein [Caudoviricetes sp.]
MRHGFRASRTVFRSALRPPTNSPPSLRSSAPSASKRTHSLICRSQEMQALPAPVGTPPLPELAARRRRSTSSRMPAS